MTRRSAALAIFACVALGTPVSAQDYASGQDAYVSRDWDAAREIWTQEAEQGSAEAMLGLGNLADFGLGQAPDQVQAFEMYLRAAELGNAEAEFNVAVMLDSGVGTEVDKRAAAAWYSFSALDDFPRAEFNLGQMYALGDGVPVNARLAGVWLREASAQVPFAQELLDTLAGQPGTALAAPDILRVETVKADGAVRARVAWTSQPGPENSRYRVEIADATAPRAKGGISAAETTFSAAFVALPTLPEAPVARVFQLTDDDYAVSPWADLEGQVVDPDLPSMTVRFELDSADRRGAGYAERMGASFERAGIGVRYEPADAGGDESAVFYGYVSDEALATDVAAFLPGVSRGEAVRQPGLGLSPGEILVRIAFDGDG